MYRNWIYVQNSNDWGRNTVIMEKKGLQKEHFPMEIKVVSIYIYIYTEIILKRYPFVGLQVLV
jgi:hypothetical protein